MRWTADEWSRAQAWTTQRATALWRADRAAWIKRGRSPRTFRWIPDELHDELVSALGTPDGLERFKALRLAHGLREGRVML